jgi:hypothetical protein
MSFFAALWSTQPPTCPSVEVLHLDSYIGSNGTEFVSFTQIMCLFYSVKCSVIVNTIKIKQLHHKTNYQCYLVDSAFTVVFRWFENNWWHLGFQFCISRWESGVWTPICNHPTGRRFQMGNVGP